MDYKQMTAPCGRDCFNCPFYLANQDEKMRNIFAERFKAEPSEVCCAGCRNMEGKCKVLKYLGFTENCKIYHCFKEKNIEFCNECVEFPCDLLHPLADRADKLPHNLKVFNLCLIKKMGLENWAKSKAKQSFDFYYKGTLDSCVKMD